MQAFKQPLSKVKEEAYIKMARDGDINARNQLVEYNLRLVAHLVKKYNIPEQDLGDYISIGTIGLIKAVNTYDPQKGSRLVTYASRCIENEILMQLRQLKKNTKDVSLYEPIGTDKEGNEIRLLDVIDNDEINLLNSMIIKDDLSFLKNNIDEILDETELTIIRLRYGLNQKKPLTQREVASLLNISRSYVSRIEKRALNKLRLSLS